MSDSPKPTSLISGIILAIFLIVLTAILLFFKGINAPVAVIPEPPMEAPVVDSTLIAVDTTVYKVKLPDGTLLDAQKGSMEDMVVAFLSDTASVVSKEKWFDFDNLLFETGKTTLTPESMTQLNNLTTILKVFPKVKIKIGSYTDNVGKPADNLKLSTDRAASVMTEVVKLGIAADRLKSEGYGEQWPVASNDTEEGRAKNRRISLRVTEL